MGHDKEFFLPAVDQGNAGLVEDHCRQLLNNVSVVFEPVKPGQVRYDSLVRQLGLGGEEKPQLADRDDVSVTVIKVLTYNLGWTKGKRFIDRSM